MVLSFLNIVVFVLGGHTTELIRLLESFPSSFSTRHYVVATSDHISEKKLMDFEKKKGFLPDEYYAIFRIPR